MTASEASGIDVGSAATEADRAAAERANRVAHLLDEAVEVPGTGFRIGIDPILGIMPVSGDAIAAVASLYIVLQGIRVGVPLRAVASMLVFVGLEFLIGSVPVLGTLFDAVVKVNKRNAKVVESHVESA